MVHRAVDKENTPVSGITSQSPGRTTFSQTSEVPVEATSSTSDGRSMSETHKHEEQGQEEQRRSCHRPEITAITCEFQRVQCSLTARRAVLTPRVWFLSCESEDGQRGEMVN